MLQIHDLCFSYAEQEPILNRIHLSWSRERCGLVGPNGSGKSTLLAVLAGELQASSGQVMRDERPLLYLPQSFGTPRGPRWQFMGESGELLKAAARLDRGTATIQEWELCEGRWGEIEALELELERWQLSHLDLEQAVEDLSSGTLQRLRLACLLGRTEALMLLDEPTNHLDQRGRSLLYDALDHHQSGVIVASHDRELLEGVDRIIEFRDGCCKLYGGNFSFFQSEKKRHEEAAEAKFQAADQAFRKARLLAQLSRERQEQRNARGKANRDSGIPRIALGLMKRNAEKTKARLAGQHEEKLGGLEEKKEALRADRRQRVELEFDLEARLSKGNGPALTVKQLNHSFEGSESRLWAEALNFELQRGERVAIVGNNGSGKSTLLNLLLGRLLPSEGQIINRSKTCLYLDQNLRHLALDQTLNSKWQDEAYISDEGLRRTMAARLGLYSEKIFQSFGTMSGGERMRAALVLLSTLKEKPDLILLDEPSNHLDLDTQDSLIHTLKQLPCTLIIVSHDRMFRQDLLVTSELDLSPEQK